MDEPIMSQSLLTASTCERNSLFYQETRTLSNRQHLKVDFYADFAASSAPTRSSPCVLLFFPLIRSPFIVPVTASDA